MPRTVRDAVLARAARLGAPEQDALKAVAVFPGLAHLPLIRAAPAAVDARVRAGPLIRDGTRIRFRHELARLAVAEATAPGRRITLHQHALADLMRQGADPAHLAHHAYAADDGAAVLLHAPHAARRASALGAHRQAVDHYAQVLRFADPLPVRDRAELLESYAEECAHVGRGREAVTASPQALEVWRALGDQQREAALLARRSHYLWITGANSAAHACVRAGPDLAEWLAPGPWLAAAYTWSAYLLMLANESPDAIEAGSRAVGLAERFGDRALLTRALNAVGTAQFFCRPELTGGTGVASATVAGAAPADDRGTRVAPACRLVSDLYRDGNTIYANAETTCRVPIGLSLFRDHALVTRQSGGAAINLAQPCTPVSFDVLWTTGAGDRLTTPVLLISRHPRFPQRGFGA
ncbi:hypothetical protein [Streptomyces sp. H27-C3]|uniref:hypothetical protein n=1 Tax=Streptomyces sp. H27-C3 TaxID=3046305 RepID=UPI0024BB3A0E|nr:hypothetical protein [Streptomyces sp. H27-C3]MDJ0463995.1 hypothetical protein [Streptomyces sp. H27-C3]